MISVRDLTKRYGDTTAVAGITFDVQPGRVTGFLGPNGAGKSTTMRRILGLDAPTSGVGVVGTPSTIEQIGDLAHALGARLHGLQPQQASLEEAYMELTPSSLDYTTRDRP